MPNISDRAPFPQQAVIAALSSTANTASTASTASTTPQPPAETGGGSLETAKKRKLDSIQPNNPRPNSGVELALRKQAQAQKIESKAGPLLSPKKSVNVMLNCQVEVAPHDQAPQGSHEAVVCRHFATEFALHPGKKSELMEQFSTRKGIEEKFDGRWSTVETSYRTIVREAPQGCKHLVSSDHFGSYLTALAATLNEGPGRPKEANCLLLTHKHAMALHVERKRKDGVDYFSAKLYDPSNTNTFKRVERPSPEALGSLTVKDMLTIPDFMSPEQLISLYAGEGNTSLSMVAVSLDPGLQPQMDRSDTTRSAQNVHLALVYGLHTELESMLQPLPQKREEAFCLLQAKTSEPAPGGYFALQSGYTESIKVFIEAVLKSKLSKTQKAELLSAKRGDGTPGLQLAFQLGHPEAVRAFTEGVLNSNLTETVKAALLAAKRSDGTPGLFLAFSKGQTETVLAFTQAVLKSKLSESVKARLLAAKTSSGRPGVLLALWNGQTETVQAFTEAVSRSNLKESVKVKLLKSVASQATST